MEMCSEMRNNVINIKPSFQNLSVMVVKALKVTLQLSEREAVLEWAEE